MAAYTLKNISEIEDAAPNFGMAPAVEARFARRAMETEILGMAKLKLAPGARLPFGHMHRDQEEVYYVLAGSGRFKVDDEIVAVKEGDLLRFGPRVWRCGEAGPDGLEYLAFGAPIADEPDAELERGWWTD